MKIYLVVLLIVVKLISQSYADNSGLNLMSTVVSELKGNAASLGSCLLGLGVNNATTGIKLDRFGDDSCSTGCYRDLLCCAPQDPAAIMVMKTWNGQKWAVTPWDDASCAQQAKCSRISYGVHGYLETPEISPYLMDMVKAMGDGDCSIMVDWSQGNGVNYFQAIQNVRSVGAGIAYHAANCAEKNPSVVLKIAGLSLGGQIVGEVGRHFEKRAGRKFDICHGLDPAGPLYDGCTDEIRLNAKVCKEVQVLHTNGMLTPVLTVATGLGTGFKSGQCDFWVNCGHNQGGNCVAVVDVKQMISGVAALAKSNGTDVKGVVAGVVCSHLRAGIVYTRQLQHKCFKGVDCGADCATSCTANTKTLMAETGTRTLMAEGECTGNADFYVKTAIAENFCPTA